MARRPLVVICPRWSLKSVAVTLRLPAPACSITPPVLFSVAAPKFRLALLTAMRPPLLSRLAVGELSTIRVSPVPLWMICPPWLLFRLATCSSSCPALKVPWRLSSTWPSCVWALMRKVPGVTTRAWAVVTLPLAAASVSLAALLWLALTSTNAPLSAALPAARFWPLAIKPWLVVTLKSPLLARLPSALTPAPSKLLAALLTVLAVRVVLPCAAITPLLLTAPLAFKLWLPAAYRLPLLLTLIAAVLRWPPA